jgi:hypothetical protein
MSQCHARFSSGRHLIVIIIFIVALDLQRPADVDGWATWAKGVKGGGMLAEVAPVVELIWAAAEVSAVARQRPAAAIVWASGQWPVVACTRLAQV